MIIALYSKHKSLREVSRRTGIGVSTLWYRLQKAGVLVKKSKVDAIAADPLLTGTYVGLWAGDGSRFRNNGYITKIHLDKRDDALSAFCKEVIFQLFGKRVSLYLDGKNDNRASLKIHSKFVYEFPTKYLTFSDDKSKTIALKKEESAAFVEGFLLGITLSDGYLKNRFVLSTVSQNLAAQVSGMLIKRGLAPQTYVHKRARQGWNDLYMVRLGKRDSLRLEESLNQTLRNLGFTYSVCQLKRYK